MPFKSFKPFNRSRLPGGGQVAPFNQWLPNGRKKCDGRWQQTLFDREHGDVEGL